MKAILIHLMRFLRYASDRVPDMPQIDLRIDPPDHVPRWSRDDPPDPNIPTLRNPWSRIRVIYSFIDGW